MVLIISADGSRSNLPESVAVLVPSSLISYLIKQSANVK